MTVPYDAHGIKCSCHCNDADPRAQLNGLRGWAPCDDGAFDLDSPVWLLARVVEQLCRSKTCYMGATAHRNPYCMLLIHSVVGPQLLCCTTNGAVYCLLHMKLS